jgi:hypothetical protein
MKKHLEALKNDNVKNKVISILGKKFEVARPSEWGHRAKGAGANLAHGLSFGLSSKIKPLREAKEKFEREDPFASKLTRGTGDIAGFMLPGPAAVKGLSKIPLVAKLIKGGGLGKAAGRSAIHTAAPTALESIISGKDSPVAETLSSAASGAALGAALGGSGKLVKGVAKLIKGKKQSPYRAAKAKMDVVGEKLFSQLSPKDIAHIRDIIKNPISSSVLKLDTLLHRPTAKTKAILDKMYLNSPQVRDRLIKERGKLADFQLPHLEEKIIKVGGTGGQRPDVESFIKNIKEKAQIKTKPLYEKAFTVTDVKLPKEVLGSPQFKEALKAAKAARNEVNIKDPTYGEKSARTLHRAKQHLWDKAKRLERGASPDLTQSAEAKEAHHKLMEALGVASPDYKQATGEYQKYFKVKDAAKAGKEFKKSNLPKIEQMLSSMSDHEKYAYKTGALQSLLEGAEKKAANTKLGDVAREFDIPQVKQMLNKIVGEERTGKLAKNLGSLSGAVETLNDLTRGSKTGEHIANMAAPSAITVLGAAKLQPKALARIGSLLKSKLTGVKEGHDADTQLRLLLNPKNLLRYEKKKSSLPKHQATPYVTNALLHENKEEE